MYNQILKDKICIKKKYFKQNWLMKKKNFHSKVKFKKMKMNKVKAEKVFMSFKNFMNSQK